MSKSTRRKPKRVSGTQNRLTARQTAARLGVKVQTVYAYVSREALTRHVAADGRTSLFDIEEVEALARRGRPRGRRVGAVEVSLASGLTRVRPEGALEYRGRDLETLPETVGFEQVAELLWTGTCPARARWSEAPNAEALRASAALPASSPPVERFIVVAGVMACHQPLRIDLDAAAVRSHTRGLIATFAASLPRVRGAAKARGRSGRVAMSLWPGLSALPPTPRRIRALDTALLVLADHELATSTLAARVAASTRADPLLAVVAGLAAVSGSLHGRAATGVHRLLLDAAAAAMPEAAVVHALAEASAEAPPKPPPGFGHPVYETRDPRAERLLGRALAIASAPERRVIETVRHLAARRTEHLMNIDFALGALAFAAKMPLGSTEAIFAVARTAGWVAHALEEYREAPLRFRARAIYAG